MRFKIIILFLLSSLSLQADPHPCPGEFAFEGQFLYGQAMVDNKEYVIDKAPDFEHRKSPELRWHVGARFIAAYATCNELNEIRFSWTYLSPKGLAKREGVALLPTQGFPAVPVNDGAPFEGRAQADVQLQYQAFDLLFGQRFIYDCPLYLTLLGGLQFVPLHFKERIVYEDFDSDPTRPLWRVTNKSDVFGLGPELALDVRYNLASFLTEWCPPPIELIFNIQTSLLISHSKASFTQTHDEFLIGTVTDAAVKNESSWRLIPTTDIRLGLRFENRFCRVNIGVEGGWEFLHIHQALNTIRFVDNEAEGASLDLYNSLDYQGPYVALSLSF